MAITFKIKIYFFFLFLKDKPVVMTGIGQNQKVKYTGYKLLFYARLLNFGPQLCLQ